MLESKMFPFLLAMTVLWVSIPSSLAQVTVPVLRQFTLTPSTDHLIHNMTQNFSLECAFNTSLQSSQAALSEISRIRIMKADDGDHWNMLAEIRDLEVGVHLYDNILGVGQISTDISSSYLKIIWPVVTTSTFGRYRCDVPGFGNNLDYAVETSNIVILTEYGMTARDVFNLLVAEQNRVSKLESDMDLYEDRLQTLKHNMTGQDNLLVVEQNRVNKLESDMNLYEDSLKTLNQSIGYRYEPWPEGTYSLLAPVTGCPHSSEWRKGYFKIHTESANPASSNYFHDDLPPYAQFSDGGQNFMILTYCSKIKSTPGIYWPSGSYCINERGSSCPTGFQSGYITLDTEDTSDRSRYGGYYPKSSYDRHDFCCRSDGSASTSIDLPTADPFFLYRFRGTCQSVTNMSLRTSYIRIDTEDSNNIDAYSNTYHPDGSLNPVVMQLCHYEPY